MRRFLIELSIVLHIFYIPDRTQTSFHVIFELLLSCSWRLNSTYLIRLLSYTSSTSTFYTVRECITKSDEQINAIVSNVFLHI